MEGQTDGRNGRTDDAKTISLRLRRGIKKVTDQIEDSSLTELKIRDIDCIYC